MKTPFTSTQHCALRGIVQVLLIAIGLALILFALSGCNNRARDTSKAILDAQTPGSATGAGATLTSPGNSAAPTIQNAVRRMAYYPPTREPLPRYAPAADVSHRNSPQPNAETEPAGVVTTTPAAPFPQPPAPYWIEEKTETTIGQHQDAAGIMKVAATLDKWPTVKWLGLLSIVGGISGLLWAAGHDQGYPLVCWKFVGAGLVLIVLGDNPWALTALIVPIGFYLSQKYNLARLFL